MKNSSRLARLRRMADWLLPADPDHRILLIRVVRTSPQERDVGFVPEMINAHAWLHGHPADGVIGDFVREASETEREFLDRVRAVVRPHTKRHQVNVTAYAFDH